MKAESCQPAPTCPLSALAYLLDRPASGTIPGEKTDRKMDTTDPDRHGLEAGAADDREGAVGLELALFVKHSDHCAHAVIR